MAWSLDEAEVRHARRGPMPTSLPGRRRRGRRISRARRSTRSAGSRRNHMRWRRANCRVRRTASVERVVERRLVAREVGEHLLVADGLARRCATSRAGRAASAATSSTRPASRIAANRALDPVGELGARQPDARRARRRAPAAPYVVEPGAERRERPAGELDHLERAHDAAPVARLDARRGGRVDAARARAYARARPPGSSASRVERGAHREVLARELRGRRRPPARRGRCRRRAARACRAPRCRRPRRAPRAGTARPTSPRRVGDVDQVVRHRGPLGARRLGGADVDAAVHLHRVERDDLDVAERSRERERERRLAGRGRPDEREVRGVTQATPRPGCGSRARRGAARRVDELAAQPVRRGAGDARPSAYVAGARAAAPSGAKCTSLFWRVRPDHTRRVLLRRALDQHLLDPPDARLVACAARAARPPRSSRSMRSCTTSAATKSSTIVGRLRCRAGARTRTCTRRRTSAASTTSSVRSKSSSVSPGKPTMMSVVTARSGIAARAAASRSR